MSNVFYKKNKIIWRLKLVFFGGFCYNNYMFVDFPFENLCGKTVAVAVSGGSDSMALLFFLKRQSLAFNFFVKAINVEHGIRGAESLNDTRFVKTYCSKNHIDLITFSVNCPQHAKQNRLSLEESARILRYDCFEKAVSLKHCDCVATAHHAKDNLESVLFNLFRGSGISGVAGIKQSGEHIIRPFLRTSKAEIDEYIKQNDIPFVTDSTNECTDYTRNYIRKTILPPIYKVFPDVEKSVARFAEIAAIDDDYLFSLATNNISFSSDGAKLKLPTEKALFGRAYIIILKYLGIKKDWEKKHIDAAFALCSKDNGKSLNLPFGVTVYKEYDYLFFKKTESNLNSNGCAFIKPSDDALNLTVEPSEFDFCGEKYKIKKVPFPNDLTDGLYIDKDKLPIGTIIRTKKNGDIFKKFGGKTKKLSDYFTDIKIEKRKRKTIPVIACGKTVYAIFGVAVSEQTAIDNNSKTIYQLLKIN